VAGDDSLRLFCALRLSDDVVEALVRWQQRELRGRRTAPAGERLVPQSNLHVTLAFLGSRPAGEAPEIAAALRTAASGAHDLRLAVRGYRETRSVGMLTFDDEDRRAGELAERVHGLLEELGVYEREQRPWLPHVTVLRFREQPGLRPKLPELGVVVPSDAAVYISRLRPGGAEYEVLETVVFGQQS
jgi:RNA 2',3'-cyclic 3'-phosphodiesterase